MSLYINAVCIREQEHMPLIGPCIDRRTLGLVTRLANSASIQSKICFCCAQVRVHVEGWCRMYNAGQHAAAESPDPKHRAAGRSRSDIKMYGVEGSLSRYRLQDSDGFDRTFSCDRFVKAYATERPQQENPFANSEDLTDGKPEWLRVMQSDGGALKLLLP